MCPLFNNECVVPVQAGDQRSAVLREMLLLRHRMAFLINALQYHIQVDVIDAQFSQLLAKIEELGDDGEVQQHLHSDHGPAETSSPFSSPRSRGSSPKSRPMTVVVGTAAGADTESNQVAGNDVDRDYLAVERAHELFLSNIVKGCFMQVCFTTFSAMVGLRLGCLIRFLSYFVFPASAGRMVLL